MIKKVLFLFYIAFAGVLISNSAFAGIFVNGLDMPSNVNISKNPFFYFNTTIINSDDKVYSDLSLEYSINGAGKFETYYLKDLNFSLYNNEVRFIGKHFDVSNLSDGRYWFNLIVKEKTGAPVAGLKYPFNISNNINNHVVSEVKIKVGPSILGVNNNIGNVVSSYGNLGQNIAQNYSKYVIFELEKNSSIPAKIKVVSDIYSTYSIFHKVYTTTNNYNMTNNLSGRVFLNYSIPGTYIVRTTFFIGSKELFFKDLRMVITGKSGGIVTVTNLKDVYEKGETFHLNGVLIGPADGATKLADVKLSLEVFQAEKLVLNKVKKIPFLGFEPVNFSFNEVLNQNLTNYDVLLNLSSGDENLDNVTLHYEKLSPEFIYKDGVISKAGFKGCHDDGVCSADEKKIGNCYDCIAYRPKSQSTSVQDNTSISKNLSVQHKGVNWSYYIIFFIVIILVITLVFLIIMRNKKNGN